MKNQYIEAHIIVGQDNIPCIASIDDSGFICVTKLDSMDYDYISTAKAISDTDLLINEENPNNIKYFHRFLFDCDDKRIKTIMVCHKFDIMFMDCAVYG